VKKLLLILIFLTLPFAAQAEVKIIEVNHRSAAELEKQVREVLGEGEKVQAAGSHLVLIANGDTLEAAEKLIALLDTEQSNLVIRIRQQVSSQLVAEDASAAVHYGNKNGISTSGSAGFRRGNTESSQEQQLQVVEGGKGLIEMGRDIPFSEKWAVVTGGNTGYSQEIAYKAIVTDFWVSPEQVIGEKVLVDVEPYVADAEQTDSQAPFIDFSQLLTRLQVPLGEWYPLGSQLMQRDKVSRAIISWRSSGNKVDRQLEIKIDKVK